MLTLAITRLARVTLQSETRHRRQLRCIALLAFLFYCDCLTRNSKRLCLTPDLRATSSEFNVDAVVRLRHKSPRGKSIGCLSSVNVQKSSASFQPMQTVGAEFDEHCLESKCNALWNQIKQRWIAACDLCFIRVIRGQQCDSIQPSKTSNNRTSPPRSPSKAKNAIPRRAKSMPC